jgi:hypothetical protein
MYDLESGTRQKAENLHIRLCEVTPSRVGDQPTASKLVVISFHLSWTQVCISILLRLHVSLRFRCAAVPSRQCRWPVYRHKAHKYECKFGADFRIGSNLAQALS